MSLPEVLGVLGFIISLITFILTRIEKRKNLIIDIYDGTLTDFDNPNLLEYHEDTEFIIIDITNGCPKPIVIDKDSIRIVVKNKEIDRRIDWVNIDETRSLLNPGTQIKYGVYFRELCDLLGIDDKALKEYKIEAHLKDLTGTKYKSKRKYLLNNVGINIRKE